MIDYFFAQSDLLYWGFLVIKHFVQRLLIRQSSSLFRYGN